MTENENEANPQAFQLVDMEGIGVMVGHSDRAEVIRNTMVDLKTTIDGCMVQTPSRDTFDTLARQCSIFLRKMAVGDDRNPPLLDVETCRAAGIGFHKLRAVRGERQIETVVQNIVTDSKMHATLRHPETGELLGEMSHKSTDPWEFNINRLASPGNSGLGWIANARDSVGDKPGQLFDLKRSFGHDCSRWLDQQLVLFDNRSVTLGNAIRAVINAEGAHAPLMVPLMRPEEGTAKSTPDTIRNPGAYILLCVVTCGITYAHVIAIETGLYLYLVLAQSGLVEQFRDVDSVPAFLLTAPEADCPPGQTPLRFEGSIMLPSRIRPGGQHTSHRIKAPRPR